jgi:hypothetical protein
MKLIHVEFGKRDWELQANTESGYLHWTGPPFMTKRQALRVLPVWKGYDFFSDVAAVNVRSGERVR